MAAPDATAAGHVKLRLAAACAFNDHRGFRTPAEGAEPSVYLATLPDDGPSGILWATSGKLTAPGGYGPLPF